MDTDKIKMYKLIISGRYRFGLFSTKEQAEQKAKELNIEQIEIKEA